MSIEQNVSKNKLGKIVIYVGSIIYMCILFAIHFIRIFDQNFWGDEAFTINTIRESFGEMINITASDVHPPLYYIIVKILCEIMGYNSVVYHLASLIPYGIMLLLTVTIIWKWFGKEVALIFATMSSLLTTAMQMAVEVRMYSWGALFVLISYLALYRILKDNKSKYWILFVVSSLSAAYIHYYCLISVAFLYVVLILDTLIRRKENLKKTILTCVITVLAYLPWFLVLIETFQRTTENFWQTEVEALDICLEYIFYSDFTWIFLSLFVFSFLLYIFVKKPSVEFEWSVAGVIAVFGTLLIGTVVSIIVRPVFIARYLYPVSVVAWLLLGVFVSKLKFKSVFTIVIVGMMLWCGLPEYSSMFINEKNSNECLEDTLDITRSEIDEGDVIASDNAYIVWAVAECYYPECSYEISYDILNDLDKEKEYWFMLNEKLNDDQIESLVGQGFNVSMIKEDGVLGTYPVVVYKINAFNE